MTSLETAFAEFVESRTLEAAQRLEVMLDEKHPDDPLIQECVEILAAYRPGGGDLLFDERQIEPHLQRVRAHLGFRAAAS